MTAPRPCARPRPRRTSATHPRPRRPRAARRSRRALVHFADVVQHQCQRRERGAASCPAAHGRWCGTGRLAAVRRLTGAGPPDSSSRGPSHRPRSSAARSFLFDASGASSRTGPAVACSRRRTQLCEPTACRDQLLLCGALADVYVVVDEELAQLLRRQSLQPPPHQVLVGHCSGGTRWRRCLRLLHTRRSNRCHS